MWSNAPLHLNSIDGDIRVLGFPTSHEQSHHVGGRIARKQLEKLKCDLAACRSSVCKKMCFMRSLFVHFPLSQGTTPAHAWTKTPPHLSARSYVKHWATAPCGLATLHPREMSLITRPADVKVKSSDLDGLVQRVASVRKVSLRAVASCCCRVNARLNGGCDVVGGRRYGVCLVHWREIVGDIEHLQAEANRGT